MAARDLAPGTVVSAETVNVSRVHVDGSVLATLFRADELSALRGRVVTATVHAGELIAQGVVSSADAQSSTRVMSFSIARARAVGGKLSIGDRVDVLAVDHDTGTARYVLTNTQLVAIEGRSGGALSGASDDVTITLVVDRLTAPKLAAAVDAGAVTLVRSTGAPAVPDEQTDDTAPGSK